MIKITSIFIWVLITFLHQTAGYAQKSWDKKVIEEANTARDVKYLTEEEKQIVLYTNLLRLDPLLFRNTFLKQYIDSTRARSRNVKSLIKTLENTQSLPVLLPSASLYKIAKEHAIDFGKQGKTGHGNFKKRFDKYLKSCTCTVAENCYYGDVDALNVVIALLIDENVSNLGHRKNLLNPVLTKTGVYISPHKTYKKSCVADYSSAVSD